MQLSRAYEGTGRRLRRLLKKAEAGEKVTVGIIGGSVSEGVGVPQGQRWHELVAKWFQDKGYDSDLVIGAVPGRGSE